jgi:uncharacterized protein (DUF433 family)
MTTDELFRQAVALIGSGDVPALERLLAEHPQLAQERLTAPGSWLRDKIGGALDGFFEYQYPVVVRRRRRARLRSPASTRRGLRFSRSRIDVEYPREDIRMNDRIVIDPAICHGKPIIRGTRTPVTVVLDALAGGDTFEMIQSDYDITADDIRACIAFANHEVKQSRYFPAPA